MKALAVAGLIACLASLPALADCVEPQDPFHMPDGATASREDMVAALQAMHAYDAAVKEFTECEQKSNRSQIRANRAVDKLNVIAGKFNTEMRAFKQRNSA
jgi:hypothetical protein